MSDYESLAIQPNVYYTVDEAADLLRVSRKNVLQLLSTGKAQGVKIGRKWRILGAALLTLAARNQEPEKTHISEWLQASTPSLAEVWDNEEDAIYDQI